MLGILDDFGSYNPYPVAASGFLLGTQVTLVLFGLHVGQIFRYYYRFGHDDRKAYRYGLVPAVFVVSATHIALVVVSMYHYYVEGILRPQVWGAFYWVSVSAAVLTSRDCRATTNLPSPSTKVRLLSLC
jgi:hypothetical protein